MTSFLLITFFFICECGHARFEKVDEFYNFILLESVDPLLLLLKKNYVLFFFGGMQEKK